MVVTNPKRVGEEDEPRASGPCPCITGESEVCNEKRIRKRVGEEDEPRLDGEEGGDELEKKMNIPDDLVPIIFSALIPPIISFSACYCYLVNKDSA
ncbi:unnamed protein product [Vicia faba]|uniref:Uncharacterized protein n=1 Tax=Vicia faba TaxID=3906 RepID=A0AAV0YZG8_VICFA|nr:unnamed protein product [Vicia faba]